MKGLNFGLITLVLSIAQATFFVLSFLFHLSRLYELMELFFILSFLVMPAVLLFGILSLIFEKNEKNKKKLALFGIYLSVAIPLIVFLIVLIRLYVFGKDFAMGL